MGGVIRRYTVAVLAVGCVSAACKKSAPDAKSFVAAWKAAAATKNANAAWALVDDSSKTRLLAALEKTRALKDPMALTAANACLGVDLTQPADVIAFALLARQLAEPIVDAKVTAAGSAATIETGTTKTALVLEHGAWRAQLTAHGFATSDGAPICMTFDLPVSGEAFVPDGPPLKDHVAVSYRELETQHTVRRLPPADGDAVANDGVNHFFYTRAKNVTTKIAMTQDNTTLDKNRWIERFDVAKDPDGKYSLRWKRDQALMQRDGALRLIAHTPDSSTNSLILAHTEKPTGGERTGDLSKVPEKTVDDWILPPDKQAHDELIGLTVDAASPTDFDAGFTRAGELGHLEPTALRQAKVISSALRNAIGSERSGFAIDNITLDRTLVFDIDPIGQQPGLTIRSARFDNNRDLVVTEPVLQTRFTAF